MTRRRRNPAAVVAYVLAALVVASMLAANGAGVVLLVSVVAAVAYVAGKHSTTRGARILTRTDAPTVTRIYPPSRTTSTPSTTPEPGPTIDELRAMLRPRADQISTRIEHP